VAFLAEVLGTELAIREKRSIFRVAGPCFRATCGLAEAAKTILEFI